MLTIRDIIHLGNMVYDISDVQKLCHQQSEAKRYDLYWLYNAVYWAATLKRYNDFYIFGWMHLVCSYKIYYKYSVAHNTERGE